MEEFQKDLEKFRLPNIPETVYYIPNFITPAEENFIISRVNAVPKPKWTQLLNRRLQNWGGIPHSKGMIAELIPTWLQTFLERINQLQVMKENQPNHILVNEYLPGQGIMPHLDGSLFYPTITTISCGSHTVLKFTENIDDEEKETRRPQCYSILVERASLLIVQNDLYEKFLHGIEEEDCDKVSDEIVNIDRCSRRYCSGESLTRQTRISLTIRHVPKTTKIKLRL